MSWHLNLTSISGYDTTDLGPPHGEERVEWSKTHWLRTSQRGHWKPATALRLGRSIGIVGDITVTHTTSDLNGKGTGGIDRRFLVTESGVTELEIPKDEQKAWSEMDTMDVWDQETA